MRLWDAMAARSARWRARPAPTGLVQAITELGAARRECDELRSENLALHSSLLVNRRRHSHDVKVMTRQATILAELSDLCRHVRAAGHDDGTLEMVEHLLLHDPDTRTTATYTAAPPTAAPGTGGGHRC